MTMERGWKHNSEISPNCPRCGSCNTKFCYYNNYSLTQPRYFCKACRRYWTKGGSLRNVPVGGGCRKTRRHISKTLRVLHSALPSPNSAAHHAHPPTVSSSAASDHAPHIDLALIYSNFLNQNSDSSDQEPHHQFMKTLGFDPCLEYSSSLSDIVFGLSEPSTIESHFNHHLGGLFNSMQEHKEDRIIGTAGDFELPPLPGEELASQYDMTMWSESHHDEVMVVRQAPLATESHVNGR